MRQQAKERIAHWENDATPTPAPTSTPLSVTSCWENETPGAECREEATGMEFVYVPGGCFQMGQTEAEKAQLIAEVGMVCAFLR